MSWLLLLHQLLCQWLFSGNAPDWLVALHRLFGWG
jgi:hypothetical protein